MGSRKLTYCMADDRVSNEEALRVAIASLHAHSKSFNLHLFLKDPTPDFLRWIQTKFSGVTVRKLELSAQLSKYDIKPQLLLLLIGEGHTDVVWLDSDLIICAPPWWEANDIDRRLLVVAEEAMCHNHPDTDAQRARGWGFEIGRTLPFNINTAIVRVTDHHRELIECWRDLLSTHVYRDAQKLGWLERPAHLFGDQDVLAAVLCKSEFSQVPLHFLRRGKDIIQYFGPYGYTVLERLGHLFRKGPAIVHAQGHRPWLDSRDAAPSGGYAKLMSIYNDCSPYKTAAKTYQSELTDRAWLSPRTLPGRLLKMLSFGLLPMNGLPIAVITDLKRVLFGIRKPT